MSRRHTSGFDILGMDRDPTPGDPDRIDELARFYEDIRDDAQTGVRVLGRGGSLSRARGESMEKLRDMLGKLPGKLQQTVDSFDAAAQAYRTYARVLRDQQTRIDTAMDQALEAVPAARRAAPRTAADATADQIAEVRAATDEITGAKARLSAAQRLAADARRLREQASARCRAALDDAADKAIKPPPRRNFFQRIGDFFRNNPIFRLIIDIVIAVVGVVLPVVGIVLAAVALVVTVAVQAANGNFELGTLLVGLVTLVPGAKLLGPLFRGAKSVAPGLVKTVSGGAQAFGRIGQSNTVIKGALSFGGRTGALGRQAVAEFGKGVVEEVATVGLNRAGNPNSEGFNLVSIAGGAAAGAAFGTAFDGFRKGSGDGFDLDGGPAGGTGTTQGVGTPSSSGPSVDAGSAPFGVDSAGSRVSTDAAAAPGAGTAPVTDSSPAADRGSATSSGDSTVADAGDTSASPVQSTDGPAATGDQPGSATAPVTPDAAAQGTTPPPLPPLPPPSVPSVSTGPETPRPESSRQDASDAGSTTDAASNKTGDDPIDERSAEAVKAAGSGLAGDAASAAIEERQGEEPSAPDGIKHEFVLDEDDDTGFTKKTRR